ncbi:hypothetical protein Bca4012_020089 [Brassica carinata]|uniref:CDC48 N-terminal subdomain domain-containing protein n=1 Tax=Brassica carinata TaxID=52824 RepID=A0A8X8BD44_BRACI|nr:hypothetical protein Bca52824_001487 [Brassica carinata]
MAASYSSKSAQPRPRRKSKKDFRTAMFERKKSPNRLVVDEAINDDRTLSPLSIPPPWKSSNSSVAILFSSKFLLFFSVFTGICNLMLITKFFKIKRSNLEFNCYLKGKKWKDTVCIALAGDSCEEPKIRMNKVVRSNLRVRLGDVVSIHQCSPMSSHQV